MQKKYIDMIYINLSDLNRINVGNPDFIKSLAERLIPTILNMEHNKEIYYTGIGDIKFDYTLENMTLKVKNTRLESELNLDLELIKYYEPYQSFPVYETDDDILEVNATVGWITMHPNKELERLIINIMNSLEVDHLKDKKATIYSTSLHEIQIDKRKFKKYRNVLVSNKYNCKFLQKLLHPFTWIITDPYHLYDNRGHIDSESYLNKMCTVYLNFNRNVILDSHIFPDLPENVEIKNKLVIDKYISVLYSIRRDKYDNFGKIKIVTEKFPFFSNKHEGIFSTFNKKFENERCIFCKTPSVQAVIRDKRNDKIHPICLVCVNYNAFIISDIHYKLHSIIKNKGIDNNYICPELEECIILEDINNVAVEIYNYTNILVDKKYLFVPADKISIIFTSVFESNPNATIIGYDTFAHEKR
jgi:hypothetical protein